jgi:hypothetical protein
MRFESSMLLSRILNSKEKFNTLKKWCAEILGHILRQPLFHNENIKKFVECGLSILSTEYHIPGTQVYCPRNTECPRNALPLYLVSTRATPDDIYPQILR